MWVVEGRRKRKKKKTPLIQHQKTITWMFTVLLCGSLPSSLQQCLRLAAFLPLPGWFYSSVAWLRYSWKCPRMALCWASPALEPSVAVKRSAIQFLHSGRTLNRKEGNSHSFWSYCVTTRLKQSNSSVAWTAVPAVLTVGRKGGPNVGRGRGRNLAIALFLIHSNCIFFTAGSLR